MPIPIMTLCRPLPAAWTALRPGRGTAQRASCRPRLLNPGRPLAAARGPGLFRALAVALDAPLGGGAAHMGERKAATRRLLEDASLVDDEASPRNCPPSPPSPPTRSAL